MNPKYLYDLDQTAVSRLGKEFIQSLPAQPASRFGCYQIEGTDYFSDLARYVEGLVFKQTFGNSPKLMTAEYGPYEKSSLFLIVMEHNSQMPIGALRVIKNSSAGLKSLNDLMKTPLKVKPERFFKEYEARPAGTIDVGTIAINKHYRGRAHAFIPSLLLYRSLYSQIFTDPKYKMVVAIIDRRAYDLLLTLGMPFKPMFNSRPFTYLDSPQSFAVYAHTENFYPSVKKHARRHRLSISPRRHYTAKLMRRLMSGKGLDHMIGSSR